MPDSQRADEEAYSSSTNLSAAQVVPDQISSIGLPTDDIVEVFFIEKEDKAIQTDSYELTNSKYCQI